MLTSPSRPRCLEFTVGWSTLLKLTAFAIVLFLGVKLLPLFALLALALLIAITISPVAAFFTRKGAPKWVGVVVCAALLFGSFGLFLMVVSPVAAAQIGALIKTLPTFKDHILQRLPSSGAAHELAEGLLRSPAFTNPEPLLKQCMDWGVTALTALLEFFVTLIVAVYLVADGERVYQWLIAFLPERQQQRVATAAPEIFQIIFSYMGGQVVTSLLCAVFTCGILMALHVPNALLLAVIAGVLDILPIVGFFLALAPALAMALAVSPFAAGAVVALYTFYHLLENYFIVPRVYGNRLRLSTLTVLVFCLAAGLIGGVVGAIIVLPLVASFPVIERTWLRPVLGKETVDRHDMIEEQEHPSA